MLHEWLIYGIFFSAMLCLDFFVMSGKNISVKRSLSMSGFYIVAGLAFGGYIYLNHGGIEPASQYATIYLLEQMLSVDNLLVISLIFTYFGIEKKKQHTALLFGIAGAIFFRVLFIVTGSWLLDKVFWLVYIFAMFLIYTGYKIIKGGDDGFDPSDKKFIKWLKSSKYGTFLAAIIAIELSDIMFAVDSIPASFSVSKDTFIILTANLFAVMGLRSLYHAVSYGISMFDGIEKYIGIVLVFLGAEIFAKHYIEIPSYMTMGVVFTTLAIGIYRCNKQ